MDHCDKKINTQVVEEMILPAKPLKNLVEHVVKQYKHICRDGEDGQNGNDGENGAAAVFSVLSNNFIVTEEGADEDPLPPQNIRRNRKERPRAKQTFNNIVDDYSEHGYNYAGTNLDMGSGVWNVEKTGDYLITVTGNYVVTSDVPLLVNGNLNGNPVGNLRLEVTNGGISLTYANAPLSNISMPTDDGVINIPVSNGNVSFQVALSLTEGNQVNLALDTNLAAYYNLEIDQENPEASILFPRIIWTVTEVVEPELVIQKVRI